MDTTGVTTMEPNSTWNTTASSTEIDEGLFLAYNIILAIGVVVIMISMGTSITLKDLKLIIKRPVGPLIGSVCQMLLMPACSFGYALLLGLPDNLAIGMIVIGSCPGGSVSNIITYWCKADIVLSVCMTTISTTLALGFLPLNMFVYSREWVDDPTTLPYVNMVITVLYTWVSVIIGFFLGRRFPKLVPLFNKVGSVAALLLILIAGGIQGSINPGIFVNNWQTWFGSITLPIIGFIIGFAFASIFCLGLPQKLAIGFETGIQNTALALNIIGFSSSSADEATYYSQYVTLFAAFQTVLVIGIIFASIIYFYARYHESPFGTPVEPNGELDSKSVKSDDGGAQLVHVENREHSENTDGTVNVSGVIEKPDGDTLPSNGVNGL